MARWHTTCPSGIESLVIEVHGHQGLLFNYCRGCKQSPPGGIRNDGDVEILGPPTGDPITHEELREMLAEREARL